MSKEKYYEELARAIYEYQENKVVEEIVNNALKSEVDPLILIDKGLMPGIKQISDRFSSGDAYLPELMLSAQLMKIALNILEPAIRKNKQVRKTLGKTVIGTVKGDIHDIGKNIVVMMMEIAGFEVYDLGVDVSVEKYLDAVEKYDPLIVGAGAFLSTTVGEQKKIIDAINESKKRRNLKYFVGGTAATIEWAESIGADGYADNAIDTVKKMKVSLGII